jgi:hypothetical protein
MTEPNTNPSQATNRAPGNGTAAAPSAAAAMSVPCGCRTSSLAAAALTPPSLALPVLPLA